MENSPVYHGHSQAQAQGHEEGLSLTSYVRILLQFKWIVMLIFTVVMAITVLITVRSPEIYSARARLLIDQKRASEEMFFLNPMNGSSGLNNSIEILRSRPVMRIAADLLKKHKDYASFPIIESDDVAGTLLKSIDIEPLIDTDILAISFESTSPGEVKAVVNAVANAFKTQNMQHSRAELTNIRQFLDEQLTNITTRLENSEEDLRTYKLREGISLLSEETKRLIESSADVEAQLSAATTDLAVSRMKLTQLRRQLGQQDSLLINVNSILVSPLLTELRQEIVLKETRMANLLTKPKYTPNHPEIISLNKELQNAKKKLTETVAHITSVKLGTSDPLEYRSDLINNIALSEIEVNVAGQKVTSLQEALEEYNRKMTVLPDTEIEMARYERAFKINESIHDLLVAKYEDAKIAEQAEIGNVRIIEEAELPTKPIKPRKKVNLLVGIMFGSVLAVAASLILHTMDTKIRTIEDIESYTSMPVFGTIPHIKQVDFDIGNIERKVTETDEKKREEMRKLYAQISGRLISVYSPKSPVAEAYRTLRTNVLAARHNAHGAETILISSSGPKEGKSTTTANLAITLAQMNSRCVLVDVDLRRPMLHNIFHVERETGVSDFLLGDIDDIKSLVKDSGVPNLDLITSGLVPANPSELIASAKMDTFLDELKSKYDYVMIDSPPIIAVTDALILARKIDQLLLVIRSGVTDKDAIKRTNMMVKNVNLNISGIVVNGIQFRKYYKGGYSYYNYYYYYYSDPSQEEDDKNKRVPKFLRQDKPVS